MNDPKPSLLRSLMNKRMVICMLCGFSSGMPLYVLFQLVPAWMRDQGVDLATIGLFALVSFPYTWKFLWSPILDRYTPLFLGRRRAWALLTQIALLVSLACLGAVDPTRNIQGVAIVVALVAFFSASQDIVLDAHRRELLPDHELGIGNSWFVNAYRVSSLVPGSLALILADRISWTQVHWVVASFMLVGILTTLWMPEPETRGQPPKDFKAAVVEPFREFFTRQGTKQALLVLLFMLLYKLGDSMATALVTPFYLDTGFTMTQIGSVAKAAALWSSVVGGLIGGAIMIKLGIRRSLWIFGVLQLVSILGFAALAQMHPVLDLTQARQQSPFRSIDALSEYANLDATEIAPILPFIAVTADGHTEAAATLTDTELSTFRPDLNTLDPEDWNTWLETADSPADATLREIDLMTLRDTAAITPTDERIPDPSLRLLLNHFSWQTTINTATEEELARHPLISEEDAEILVSARNRSLFQNTSDLPALTDGIPDELAPMLIFTIDLNTASPQALAALAPFAPSLFWLFFVVSFEYLGVGMGTAAFVAFIAYNTDKRYTATQFALLTSLTGIPRTFANATTGMIVETIGWAPFFYICTAIAIPGMLLLIKVAPWGPDPIDNRKTG